MTIVGEWRFLETPTEQPALLSFGQAVGLFQVFGLSAETPTSAVSVVAVRDHVVLVGDGVPIVVKSRAEWRKALDAWRPMPIVPDKG